MTTPRYSSRWAALRCAVVADQWLYADFRQLLLAAGVTADAIDRKRIFIAGAALFCLSSLLFCLTHNLFLSGVLRALQGTAAAMILASGSAALAQLYDGAQRTRAFSILGTVFGAGLGVRSAADRLHDRRGGLARRIRPVCAALGRVLLIGLVSLPATEKASRGHPTTGPNPVYAGPDAVYCIAYGHSGPRFLSLTTLALLIASGGLFVAFVVRCRRVNNPVLELSCCVIRVLSAYCCCLSPPAVATWSC